MSFVDGLHGGAVKTAAQDGVSFGGVVARLKPRPFKATIIFGGGREHSPIADVLRRHPHGQSPR